MEYSLLLEDNTWALSIGSEFLLLWRPAISFSVTFLIGATACKDVLRVHVA